MGSASTGKGAYMGVSIVTTVTAQKIAEACACGRSGCRCGKRQGKGYITHCQAHDDPKPSLHITDRDDDLPLVHCFASCTQDAVLNALRQRGLWPNGSTPGTGRPSRTHSRPQAATPEAEYRYLSEDGSLIATKGRFRQPNGAKTFAWKRSGAGDWSGLRGLKERDLHLYNAHLLPTTDGPVTVVEGEKAANACLDAGLLAVCPPGGASAKDFGEQPKALAGRDVILWPDNDSEGRALMQRFSVKLQGVAASVRTVALDVPAKGDAYDYFSAGGTKGGVLAEAAKIRTAPWIEELVTGYQVGIPESGGAAMFRFESLQERLHVLQAEVTTWLEMPGFSREPFSARLNLLSLSNREAYRRQLDEMIPMPKGIWTILLNRACAMIRKTYAEADASVDLSGISDSSVATRHLIWPVVLEDGPAILFGKGGSAKTYLALRMAASLAKGADFLSQPSQQGGTLFLDYESTAPRIKGRLSRVLAGMEMEWGNLPFIYWPAKGRPLTEIVPALQRKIREAGTRLIIVDSAALACGGEPEKAEVAIAYFNALAALEIPSLTLAHVTKGEENEYPFGSIFWHNSARATFNVQITHEDGRNVAHVGLFNRKANEERLAPPLGIRLEFNEAKTTFSREELVAGAEDRANLGNRIRAALSRGEQSIKQLAETLSLNHAQVRTRLNQMTKDVVRRGTAEDGTGLWGLEAHE